jgi:hypothetical protein
MIICWSAANEQEYIDVDAYGILFGIFVFIFYIVFIALSIITIVKYKTSRPRVCTQSLAIYIVLMIPLLWIVCYLFSYG